MTITYALEPDLGPEEFIDILVRSALTLSKRRPIDDRPTISGMLFAKSSERFVSFRWIHSEHTIQPRWSLMNAATAAVSADDTNCLAWSQGPCVV